MKPTSYTAVTAIHLIKCKAQPGDIITLSIRNEDTDDGMFSQTKRLVDMFVQCYGFWPSEVAIHPDHLDLIKKVGKSLDVTIPESISGILGKLMELTDLPTRIPLVADESLDLFTAVARYHFKKENTEAFLKTVLEHTLRGMH